MTRAERIARIMAARRLPVIVAQLRAERGTYPRSAASSGGPYCIARACAIVGMHRAGIAGCALAVPAAIIDSQRASLAPLGLTLDDRGRVRRIEP